MHFDRQKSIPLGLKPAISSAISGTDKSVPFQNHCQPWFISFVRFLARDNGIGAVLMEARH